MITKNLLGTLTLSALLMACGSKNSEQEATTTADIETDSTAVAETPSSNEVEAVGIWDKVSVRATPSEDGKWLTSVSLGESLTYLGEEAKDSNDKVYYKIRLNDGKEGWVRHEFVVPEAKSAVFVNESDIYNRPDLLTKSDKKFSKMDIIAVKQTQDDWVEVAGKRTNGKWIETGWVRKSNISYEPVDIAMAKFAKPAMETEDTDSRAKKLEEVLNNVDLSSSAFVTDVKEALDEIRLNAEAPEETDDASTEEDSMEIEDEEVLEEDGN
ncbi:SH3 domain-containing protein [Fulvivirga ulvae]|uniref:SH3 domain-containing protein n=1 Tax=Fulvivirga ulvae TaxID=2904245 RepID=UPI001F1CCB6A|nr:SH3 domain-containing protein [Fulvivirga ulvae]UII29930.1 SH3 domain-containing protein [Fulvivirga ulvae]